MKSPDCPHCGDPMMLHRDREGVTICVVCDHAIPAGPCAPAGRAEWQGPAAVPFSEVR
jgi:ribosomal protein L37AE/L43A